MKTRLPLPADARKAVLRVDSGNTDDRVTTRFGDVSFRK